MGEKKKSKLSLKERLAQKRDNLSKGGGGFATFLIKDGTNRFRHVPVGEENDWSHECTTFFVDGKLVVSAHTFGEPCALWELHEKLSNSKKEKDREFGKKNVKPGRKLMMAVIKYTDEKGKQIDTDNGVKLLPVTPGVGKELIELFLDDEGGDFTDPLNGYDIKYKKTGKGMTGTEYQVIKCNPTKLDKAFRKPVDLVEMVRALVPSYKDSQALAAKLLNAPIEDDAEEAPKKKKKKSKSKDL